MYLFRRVRVLFGLFVHAKNKTACKLSLMTKTERSSRKEVKLVNRKNIKYLIKVTFSAKEDKKKLKYVAFPLLSDFLIP